MYFLSFETSTKIFSVALSRDEKVLRFRNLKTALVLEDSILPAMDKLIEAAGVKFEQIDGFAVALGPGSFTSLRVGLATVKAFALSTGKPVVGIPSLDIIARGVAKMACDEICVLNDARRNKVYACLYGPGGHPRKTDYLLTSLDDVLDKVHGRTLFVGDALNYGDTHLILKKFYAKLGECHQNNAKKTCQPLFAGEKYWYPRAKVMAQLAYERFRSKQYDDAAKLLPYYLYPSDCQVSTKQAHER